ncbi:MAG: ribonuclease R [Bacteroides sp.]|nr:ribonuclease R [Eubacterium sp.]MCM1418775.1 ribonuclease R [Roseburia sp.]MCM1462432.1 ribonuclease R [Bacteroides sp.]
MKETYRTKIVRLLLEAKKEGMSEGAILSALEVGKKGKKQVLRVLSDLERSRTIARSKGMIRLKGMKRYFTGTVVRVAPSHGFIRNETTGEDLFVRGRDLLGAIPGDTVLARVTELRDERHASDSAAVVLIEKETEGVLTGTIADVNGDLRLRPDSFAAEPLRIVRRNGNELHNGDKVKFSIVTRAEHHGDITAKIEGVYGSSDFARVSVDAYLEEKAIPIAFPDEAIGEAERIEADGIKAKEIAAREDLRALPIFTIDGADTKDIDDAISISKTKKGFSLGVHIADVSYYVKKGSPLDDEAFRRGTSVYIADRVIPMLPKQLSNGICSLNPNTERLAFSCLMELDKSGEIASFRFAKSVIRSRVQGVYAEVNRLIDGTADEATQKKYAEVSAAIPVMCELTELLKKNRIARGAPEIDSRESKIICDKNGVCVDIKERARGFSEEMIEEFMLCANNCAAKLAMEKCFPFVYRVHESPDADKLLQLQQTLVNLGEDPKGISEKSTAADLAALLRRTKESPRAQVVGNLVLRTMMKAKYSEEPLGHFGLVMKEYAHFTSPIRRYADLSIHRILTDVVSGAPADKLDRRFKKFAHEAAVRASATELVAVAAERDCDKFYMAEYMRGHVGEEYAGFISGVIASGFFVKLENTVEGKVDTLSLPAGAYELRGGVALAESLSNTVYTVGDRVRVKCVRADVSAGQVDFILV